MNSKQEYYTKKYRVLGRFFQLQCREWVTSTQDWRKGVQLHSRGNGAKTDDSSDIMGVKSKGFPAQLDVRVTEKSMGD